MRSSPRPPLLSSSCIGPAFQPRPLTTPCLGTSHQIWIRHIRKGAHSVTNVQGIVGPQACVEKCNRYRYPLRSNKCATCYATIDICSRADAYHAVRLSTIPWAVSSDVHADASAFVYGLCAQHAIFWQSLHRWPKHSPRANKALVSLPAFLTTHCQLYDCGVL